MKINDSKYKYEAQISRPDGMIITGEVTDIEQQEEMVRLTINNIAYITHSSNVLITIKESDS